MAWLTTDALPSTSGWGGPPQLQAGNIGELVKGILGNRLAQQKMTQESIADAIKQYQSQRQSSAYADALRNAGLTQGQDISGLDSEHATALAKLIQEQTPDTESDTLKTAMANYYNKLATTGGTRGGPAGPRPFTQGQQFNALKTQAGVLGGQADELQSQQEDYGLPAEVGPATHGYVMRNGKLDYARTPEEQAKPDLVSPGDPITDPNAKTFTPDVYAQRQAQSDARKQILAEQKRVQQQILAPQGIRQADVDQANQAQGMPGAQPSATPTGSGQSSGLRQQAISILQSNNKPVTEANIQAVVGQLGGG